MCSKPFRRGIDEYGCGQCLPCRINKSRLWTSRLMLESFQHEDNTFATMTYNEENLPEDGGVSVREAQLFLKRLRRAVEPEKFRYFIVGEYGEQSWRPHYHAILFGLPTDRHVNGKACSCEVCLAWPFGYTYLGTVTPESTAYCARYVTKKMTNANDSRLQGRPPEFARMSLKPGIGAGAIESLVELSVSEYGCKDIVSRGDVLTSFHTNGRLYPLGRYLRRKLRESLGWIPGEPELAHMKRITEVRETLSVPGAIAARESKRIQVGRIASRRSQINASRRISL